MHTLYPRMALGALCLQSLASKLLYLHKAFLPSEHDTGKGILLNYEMFNSFVNSDQK